MKKLVDPEEALRALEEPQEKKAVAEKLTAATWFEIDVVGKHKKRYKGRFLFNVPTIGAQIRMGALKSVYLPQGAAADPNAALAVEVIAYLTVAIEFNDQARKPDWWDPINGYDMKPYMDLYGRCFDYEARFHGGEDERSGVREEAGAQGVRPGDAEAPLGSEVQPPAKRRETLTGDGA